MKKNNKTIAIIGGMGPQASAKFLEVFIDVCAKEFNAKSDSDFPEVILNSVSVPNFVSNEKNLELTLKILRKRVKKLEAFNPAFFSITCNTAHLFVVELQKETNVPFVSIIEEVSKKVSSVNIEKIGLLGSPITINSCLYQSALKQRKIDVILPSQKEVKTIEKVIANVLSGKILNSDRRIIINVAISLKKKGAEGIILGCTELPLIFPKNFSIPIFDSIEILANSLAQKAFERNIDYE